MYLFYQFAQIISRNDLGSTPTGDISRGSVDVALSIIFSIAGAVALLIIAISAFRIVISRGKSEDVSKARNAIIYAAIGLAVSMLAFTIVQFVAGNI